MCMAEIENRDSLRQTTGDKLNETGRQTHKLRNGQMLNEHLLKIIKISHIPLNISTFYRST